MMRQPTHSLPRAHGSTSNRPWAVVAVSLAAALLMSSGVRAEDARAILDLHINGMNKGQVLVIVRGSDVLVPIDALTRAGLKEMRGRRARFEGRDLVSLESLAPDVTFAMDERSLVLRLAVAAHVFRPTRIIAQPTRPPDVTYRRDSSGFINYALNWRGRDDLDVFAETGLSVGGALVSSSFSRVASERLQRGFSSAIFDQRSRLVRWTVGDVFVSTGPLGGGVALGGVTFAREYSLDPYFNRFPTVGLAAATTTPSTVEVYVNDQLIRREQVPPGQFEIDRVPVPNGRGEAHIIVRDAFGREQQISNPFYLSTAMLSRGLHEFRYSTGYTRRRIGSANFAYARPMFLARHRYGFTDDLTAGFRAEGSNRLVSGGPTVTARTLLGEFEFTLGLSQNGRARGVAGSFGYAFIMRPFSVGVSLASVGAHYSNVSLRATDDRALSEANGFISIALGPSASLSLQQSVSDWRKAGYSDVTDVTGYLRLTAQSSLSVSARRNRYGAVNAREVFVGLNVFPADRTTASVAWQQTGESHTATAEVQRSLPLGTGFGYRARLHDVRHRVSLGLLQYQGPYGRYELVSEQSGVRRASSLIVSGGLVGIGGHLYPTRTVQDSFALVRVPGVPRVRAYASNHEIGQTNRRGELLVPNLLSYYGNRLAIDQNDIPFNYSIARLAETVATPYRGGAVVTFPVSRVQTLTGNVLVTTTRGSRVPAYGQFVLTRSSRTFESPVGSQGEFYFENLQPGRYEGRVEYTGGACHLVVEIPASEHPMIDVGILHCTPAQRTAP